MYYQSYEEYMRDVLGYPNTYSNNNRMPTYGCCGEGYANSPQTMYTNMNSDLEELYPDIYKVVQPMVRKVCDKNTKPITKETLDEMTLEVYMHLEIDENDSVGATVNVQVRNNPETRQTSNNNHRNKEEKQPETRQRPQPNRLLQDLIRILILRELLNRPGNRPPQPRPPRPPFPGGRPPMPRSNYIDGMYY